MSETMMQITQTKSKTVGSSGSAGTIEGYERARDALLLALERERCTMGLSQKQFARFLGVAENAWSLTRLGRYLVGDKILGAVAAHLPALGPLALDYMAQKSRSGIKNTYPLQPDEHA